MGCAMLYKLSLNTIYHFICYTLYYTLYMLPIWTNDQVFIRRLQCWSYLFGGSKNKL